MRGAHQLLQARNYKVEIVVGAVGEWKISMANVDKGAGQNLVSVVFMMTAWTPVLQTGNASCIRPASNNPMKSKRFISLYLQRGLLHANVGLLKVPGLVSNIFLGRAFFSRYIKKILPKAGTIKTVSSSLVAISRGSQEKQVRGRRKERTLITSWGIVCDRMIFQIIANEQKKLYGLRRQQVIFI